MSDYECGQCGYAADPNCRICSPMTPTPEMIAMARRIARKAWCRQTQNFNWNIAYEAALTAIMEVSEKASGYADAYARGPHIQKQHGKNIATAIRNGEYLK